MNLTPLFSIDRWRAVALSLLVHVVAFSLAFFGLLWQGTPRLSAAPGQMEATLIVSQPAMADSPDNGMPVEKTAPTIEPGATPVRNSAPALQPVPKPAPPSQQQTSPWQQPWYMLPLDIPGLAPTGTSTVVPPQAVEAPVDDFDAFANPNQLRGYYAKEIHRAVYSNWIPTGVPDGVHCRVTVTQETGGDVTDISYDDCPFDVAARDAIEQALHRTPLPYDGFEMVFMRQIPLDFCQPDAACRP